MLDVIRNISYFKDVDPGAWEYLANSAVHLKVSKGKLILLEGEMTRALYVVESGSLKAVKISATGREQILQFIEPSETFNEISVLADSANPATVIALEDSVLWRVDQAAVWQMLARYPNATKIVIQQLARRLQSLLITIEDLSLRTVEARLARYLVEQASDDIVERARWATQAELSKRLGTVPDVLHRAFRALARENLIEIERQRILILDREELLQRSELDK